MCDRATHLSAPGDPFALIATVSPEFFEALAQRAAEINRDDLEQLVVAAPSPYMTVREAAEYLRAPRQRVDDLLSQGRLTRVKEGSRTLIARNELRAYLGEHDVATVLPRGARTRIGTGDVR